MISVALATYQGEKYIEEQLNSILNQKMPLDEIVIADDCSNDKTYDILLKYAEKYDQIKLIRNENRKGFIENFYVAISNCSGDYIFLCDQDDVWHKDKVMEMMNIVKENPQIQVLASSFALIDDVGNALKTNCSPLRSNHNLLSKPCRRNQLTQVKWRDILLRNFAQGASLLITKTVQQDYLYKFVNTIYHDYYINFIGAYKKGLYFYNKELFDYRLHKTNTLGLNKKMPITDKMKISYCVRDSQEAIKRLERIEMLFPEAIEFFPETQDAIDFLTKYIEYMTEIKPVYLLFLNLSPWYFKLRTIKGRLRDILVLCQYFGQ